MTSFVISPEGAIDLGISAASLRQVAAWNAEVADAETLSRRYRDHAKISRCRAQSTALLEVAADVERIEARNRRRAA